VIKDINDRKQKQRDMEKARSQNDYNRAIDFYHTSQMGRTAMSPDSPDAKS